MKIDINKIKLTPENLGFNFCQFGNLTDEISEWVNYWGFKTQKSGQFTNILIDESTNFDEIFNLPIQYEWVDGFSPNLNKHLHIGHL
jgi:arginyl-tRNA synthetase